MEHKQVNYNLHELSGSRLVVPIYRLLGHLGPKHHGLIVGTSELDDKLYVTDFGPERGACLITIDQFIEIYGPGGEIKLRPNDGELSNEQVVLRALDEIHARQSGRYNFVLNNCENAVDRAMYGKKNLSSQVKNTLKGLGFALAGGIYILARRTR